MMLRFEFILALHELFTGVLGWKWSFWLVVDLTGLDPRSNDLKLLGIREYWFVLAVLVKTLGFAAVCLFSGLIVVYSGHSIQEGFFHLCFLH